MGPEKETTSEQFLTFTLGEETYAVGIDKVREILDWTPVTKVPQCPDFMRGVVNVRGGVVPIIDLHTKFGMTPAKKTIDSCIVITQVEVGEQCMVLGILADAVQEVVDLSLSDIETAPKIGTNLNIEFIQGIGKRGDQFIIILDIDRVLSNEEFERTQAA